MARPKKTTKATTPKVDKDEIAEILGDAYDGEYCKCLMKDGTIKLFPKNQIKPK